MPLKGLCRLRPVARRLAGAPSRAVLSGVLRAVVVMEAVRQSGAGLLSAKRLRLAVLVLAMPLQAR
jgi:hypothetical protein